MCAGVHTAYWTFRLPVWPKAPGQGRCVSLFVQARSIAGTAGVHPGEFRLDISAPTYGNLHASDLGHWHLHDCPGRTGLVTQAHAVLPGPGDRGRAQSAG
ncbi:hypothetical protein D9M73_143530 [compost metagenome]